MNKINQGNAQLMSLVLVLGLAMMAAPRGIEMMAQQQSERIWDVTAGQFNTVQMAARPGILARSVIFPAIYRVWGGMSGLIIRRLVQAVAGK
ncbi:hypothetical protein FV393_22160 [Salmonella enterica]|nr:hypothetical protein [Salmonella enterica]